MRAPGRCARARQTNLPRPSSTGFAKIIAGSARYRMVLDMAGVRDGAHPEAVEAVSPAHVK